MLWDSVDDGLESEFLFVGWVFEGRELFHECIFFVSSFDEVESVGSEESVDFWVRNDVPSSMGRNSSLLKSSLRTLVMR